MTTCHRCGHSSMVRSYDGVICLLCGYEEVEQKYVPENLQLLIERVKSTPAKRGPKADSRKRRSSLSA